MKFTKLFALICAAFAFVACENTEKVPETSGSLVLKVDSTAVSLGETVTFTIEQKAEDGAYYDVTSQCVIYDNDTNVIDGHTYTFEATGTYSFFATKGSENSNYVYITVLASMPEVPADPQPENFGFNHRILLIDHTGMNCPNCPYMTDNLLALAESPMHKHYNEITCHAGSYASGDPANSPAATALDQFNSGKFSGYPGLGINFYGGKIDNYASTSYFVTTATQILEPKIKEHADVGIALAAEGDPESVYCAVQIKSAASREYKAVAWLLENQIYCPNQAGATKDQHRIFNHALRNISGEYSRNNVAGESVGVIEEGQTFDCAFELPIVSTKWAVENMEVLVIVSARDEHNRWEVVNTALCPVGGKTEFEYAE